MPSFDLVSEVDSHEVSNAVDQANREVNTRFDFKGTNSKFVQEQVVVTSESESKFQLQQMLDILYLKFTKRGIDIKCLQVDAAEESGSRAKQRVVVRQGLDADQCRQVVKHLKTSKLKVQAAVQGDKVRVTGKKRDDLQQAIALCKDLDLGMPLQFINFRD